MKVVHSSSVFLGHYSHRSTHSHVVAHLDVTVLPNNTIVGGTVTHVGQVIWGQDHINEIETTSPYSDNSVTLTMHAEDRVFSDKTAGTSSDTVINYVMLGDSLSDGMRGWITFSVHTSATYDPNYSYLYTVSGGATESGGPGFQVSRWMSCLTCSTEEYEPVLFEMSHPHLGLVTQALF